MSGQVDVRIEFVNRENATFERSQWLDGLQLELRRRQLDCKAQKQPAPENTMSLGFTEYLAIIGMIPGSISMLIDVLNYYKSRMQKNKNVQRASISITSCSGKITKVDIENGNTDIVIQQINNIIGDQLNITITMHD